MKKAITIRQFASIKQTAKIVAPLTVKKAKLQEKINALKDEIEMTNSQIENWQNGVKLLTGGLSSEDLIIRVVEPYLDSEGNQKKDKDGKPLSITKYVPNPANITYDEDTKCYYIVEKSPEDDINPVAADTDDIDTSEATFEDMHLNGI